MISFFANQMEELVQKSAWRLVRSAEDRFGSGTGSHKLSWCVERLKNEFPKANGDHEDYVRAAFVNLKTETKYVS